MNEREPSHSTNLLPPTPEEAEALLRAAQHAAYKAYRKHTRPYRSAFRGIIARRDAERFVKARLAKQTRAIQEATQ